MVRFLSNADKIIHTASPSIHPFSLPAASVIGLILGAKMPEAKRQTVIDFVRSDPRYFHLSISQAKISNRTFALDIEPLT